MIVAPHALTRPILTRCLAACSRLARRFFIIPQRKVAAALHRRHPHLPQVWGDVRLGFGGWRPPRGLLSWGHAGSGLSSTRRRGPVLQAASRKRDGSCFVQNGERFLVEFGTVVGEHLGGRKKGRKEGGVGGL